MQKLLCFFFAFFFPKACPGTGRVPTASSLCFGQDGNTTSCHGARSSNRIWRNLVRFKKTERASRYFFYLHAQFVLFIYLLFVLFILFVCTRSAAQENAQSGRRGAAVDQGAAGRSVVPARDVADAQAR